MNSMYIHLQCEWGGGGGGGKPKRAGGGGGGRGGGGGGGGGDNQTRTGISGMKMEAITTDEGRSGGMMIEGEQ